MIKNYFLTIFFLCFCASLWAQESLNAQQQKLQNDIQNYLREEGFAPSIDEDGDIKFKKEGISFYVIIDKGENSPFFLQLCVPYNLGANYDRQKVMRIANEVNEYKSVKMKLYSESIMIKAEMFLQDATHFGAVFYRTMSILGYAGEEFLNEYNK